MPSYFGANTIDNAHSDCTGSKTIIRIILLISVLSNSHPFGTSWKWSGMWWRTTSEFSSMRCLAMPIWHKYASNVCRNWTSLSKISWYFSGYCSPILVFFRKSVSDFLILTSRFGSACASDHLDNFSLCRGQPCRGLWLIYPPPPFLSSCNGLLQLGWDGQ